MGNIKIPSGCAAESIFESGWFTDKWKAYENAVECRKALETPNHHYYVQAQFTGVYSHVYKVTEYKITTPNSKIMIPKVCNESSANAKACASALSQREGVPYYVNADEEALARGVSVAYHIVRGGSDVFDVR